MPRVTQDQAAEAGSPEAAHAPAPPPQYSLCNEPLIELSNPGASGSVFYVTSDDEFIIKTVMHKEAEFLQKLLPGYYMVRARRSGRAGEAFRGGCGNALHPRSRRGGGCAESQAQRRRPPIKGHCVGQELAPPFSAHLGTQTGLELR